MSPAFSLSFHHPAHLITPSGTHPLVLAIAANSWQRFRGLMLAAPLSEGQAPQALLLAPCASVHSLFMRYTLDIAYISARGIVTHTRTLQPWRGSLGRSYQGQRPVQTLEMPAGTLARLQVQRGDRLMIEGAHR